MASFVFTDATRRFLAATHNMASADIRAALCMVGNNVSTLPNANFLSDLILAEYDGLGYARVQLTGLSLVENAVEGRTELHADNPIFPLLAPATFPAAGILFYVHVGADSANLPLCFIDKGGFPKNGNGQDFEFLLGAAGLLYVQRMAA